MAAGFGPWLFLCHIGIVQLPFFGFWAWSKTPLQAPRGLFSCNLRISHQLGGKKAIFLV